MIRPERSGRVDADLQQWLAGQWHQSTKLNGHEPQAYPTAPSSDCPRSRSVALRSCFRAAGNLRPQSRRGRLALVRKTCSPCVDEPLVAGQCCRISRRAVQQSHYGLALFDGVRAERRGWTLCTSRLVRRLNGTGERRQIDPYKHSWTGAWRKTARWLAARAQSVLTRRLHIMRLTECRRSRSASNRPCCGSCNSAAELHLLQR